MSTKQEQSIWYTPGAIVVAGVIIAAAIFFSNNTGGNNSAPLAKNDPINMPKAISKLLLLAGNSDLHVLGNPNAKVTINEYSDTECPFCKKHQSTMNGIIDSYGIGGDVAWVYRHFPLDSLHSKARKEAEATECAKELGGNKAFWTMLNTIYTRTPGNNGLDAAQLPIYAKQIGLNVTKFNECLSSGRMAATVEAQYQDGIKAGARGTPYSVITLNNGLTTAAETTLVKFITENSLSQNVIISKDKKSIVLSGALPETILKTVLDTLIK